MEWDYHLVASKIILRIEFSVINGRFFLNIYDIW